MKNSYKKTELGRIGERLAAEYLVKQGIQILEQNWRHRHKEIDIIGQDERFLIIAEVKARADIYLEAPGALVDKTKQNYLIRAADAYIQQRGIDKEVRFDLVIVVFKHGDLRRYQLEHIPDAFLPEP